MKLILVCLQVLNLSMWNIDVEKILNYHPKKIELIYPSDLQYQSKLEEVKLKGKKYSNALTIYSEKDVFWVICSQTGVSLLFKFKGDLEYLDAIETNDYTERRIGYYYVLSGDIKNRIITLSSKDDISEVLNYFKDSLKETTKGFKTYYTLSDKICMSVKDGYFTAAEIFPCKFDSNSMDSFASDHMVPKLNEGLLDFRKNISLLSKRLQIRLNPDNVKREDIDRIASKCFDFVKYEDIYEIYPELCSVVIKYTLDNNRTGEFNLRDSSENINPSFSKGGDKIEFIPIVLNTINNILGCEYFPNLYFNIRFYD